MIDMMRPLGETILAPSALMIVGKLIDRGLPDP
jgi:hypothetical protein